MFRVDKDDKLTEHFHLCIIIIKIYKCIKYHIPLRLVNLSNNDRSSIKIKIIFKCIICIIIQTCCFEIKYESKNIDNIMAIKILEHACSLI